MSTYHPTDAAAADGGLEFAVQLLDGAGGIKALSQEDDPVQEEEGSDAVDDVLHQLDPVKEQRHRCVTRPWVPDPSGARRARRHSRPQRFLLPRNLLRNWFNIKIQTPREVKPKCGDNR